MKSRLQNLYKYLIENRKHEVKGWRDAYREFYGQVGQVRDRIKSGEGLSQSDETFLKQLLYEKSNGIASRGQSVLSYDNFQLFIKDKDFLSALNNSSSLSTKKASGNLTTRGLPKVNPTIRSLSIVWLQPALSKFPQQLILGSSIRYLAG